jgi:hypothetical protein
MVAGCRRSLVSESDEDPSGPATPHTTGVRVPASRDDIDDVKGTDVENSTNVHNRLLHSRRSEFRTEHRARRGDS